MHWLQAHTQATVVSYSHEAKCHNSGHACSAPEPSWPWVVLAGDALYCLSWALLARLSAIGDRYNLYLLTHEIAFPSARVHLHAVSIRDFGFQTCYWLQWVYCIIIWIIVCWIFFSLKVIIWNFFFCLTPKSFPLPDLPSSSSETYACMKKFDFWKSGYFPNAFNSTEDMKYCAESSGKPTINGMKIPSVNDWAHETVWVIKMLCRTELKIFTGLSVRHCLKDVLGLDSGSHTECRHCSELLLRTEGGRYHVQYLVSLLFSSVFILAVPAERSSS